MINNSEDLKIRMSNLSNIELLNIVGKDKNDYTEEALAYAVEELNERNVEFSNLQPNEEKGPNIKLSNSKLSKIAFGIIMSSIITIVILFGVSDKIMNDSIVIILNVLFVWWCILLAPLIAMILSIIDLTKTNRAKTLSKVTLIIISSLILIFWFTVYSYVKGFGFLFAKF